MTLHFDGLPYADCRSMSCHGATLGPFCATHAALSDERARQDAERDADTARWNAAVATGDESTIGAAMAEILRRTHTRIMDDDPNYREAGWS